jgi:hypothetical protein
MNVDEPHIHMRLPDYIEKKRQTGEPLTQNELCIKLLSESSYLLEILYQIFIEAISPDGIDDEFLDAVMADLYDFANKSADGYFAKWRIAMKGYTPVHIKLVVEMEGETE